MDCICPYLQPLIPKVKFRFLLASRLWHCTQLGRNYRPSPTTYNSFDAYKLVYASVNRLGRIIRAGGEKRGLMLHIGVCPKCGATIQHAMIEPIELWDGILARQKFKGTSFHCPTCHVVLGVGIDPYGLKEEIVSALMARLRK